MANKIIKIDDSYIAENESFDILLPVYQSVDIYGSVKKYEKDLEKFTQEQRYIFAINWYKSEVNNGGHKQFYSNSTGIVYRDALEGLRIIGADKHRSILEESMEKMGSGLSQDREARITYLSTKNVDFSDQDDEFYELDRNQPLERVLKDYIEKNIENFYFEGEVDIIDFDSESLVRDTFSK